MMHDPPTRRDAIRALGVGALTMALPGCGTTAKDPVWPFTRTLPRLTVSGNGHYLITEDGKPFFYLGDTVWELLHRLDRQQVDRYLADRAAKQFNVIQTVVLAEMNGLTTPNAYGELPLSDLDPARPNERYFQHVDYLIEAAARRGLYVGLLPTWGSYTVEEDHRFFESHAIFDADNAYAYGHFLGSRYAEQTHIIWILGGDRPPTGGEDIWDAMARGVTVGVAGSEDYARTLMTYHPPGRRSTAEWFRQAPWLDFHAVQSGHARDSVPDEMIAVDFQLRPPRPVLSIESGYEGIPNNLRDGDDKLTAHDVRRLAYRAVFAGSCGYVYGANEVWMMWNPRLEPIDPRQQATPFLGAERPWPEALGYPAAGQMRHLRALIESRPFLCRVPDQHLIASPVETGPRRIAATRCADGSYAMIYIPTARQPVTVDMSRLSGDRINGWWFNPRDGSVIALVETHTNRGATAFTSPRTGSDWVLVLDDAARRFPPPGGRG